MWNHQPSTMWKLGKRIISWSYCLSYPLYEELCSMYTVRWSLVRVLLTFQPTRTLLHLFNHCLRPANVAEEHVQHICQRRLPLQPSHWRGNKPSLLQTPNKKHMSWFTGNWSLFIWWRKNTVKLQRTPKTNQMPSRKNGPAQCWYCAWCNQSDSHAT